MKEHKEPNQLKQMVQKIPKIRFISHSSILVEKSESESLLCDPWYIVGIFNDSWTLIGKPNLDKINFKKIKHIWISHEHPDHLNFPTLKKIRELTEGEVTVYFKKQNNPNVREAISDIGFKVVELEPYKEKEIFPGFFINSFPTAIDTALVIRSNNYVILNQNDCALNNSQVKKIKKQYPKIDVAFYQFSFAGYNRNYDNLTALKATKEKFLNRFLSYYNHFKPSIYVPYASFVAFSKEGNSYLNKWRVSLEDVSNKMHNLPIQIMYPHDELLESDWEDRNKKNLKLWRQILEEPIEIKSHVAIDESELEQAGKIMVQNIKHVWPYFVRPPETHFQIKETGKAAVINLRKKQFRIEDKPKKNKLAGILPAEELLFFLKFSFGADTLEITSCFYVTDLFKWEWVIAYRNALYRRLSYYSFLNEKATPILRLILSHFFSKKKSI